MGVRSLRFCRDIPFVLHLICILCRVTCQTSKIRLTPFNHSPKPAMERLAIEADAEDSVSPTDNSNVYTESSLTLDAFPVVSTDNASTSVIPCSMPTNIARTNPSDMLHGLQSEQSQSNKSSWHRSDRWIFVRSFTPL